MATILLNSLADTAFLGKILAGLLSAHGHPTIFARGALGSGKTALAARIVENMVGGDCAEVSSPSFTICNYYPTRPETLHCDLYRCKKNIPDDVLEFIESGHAWAYVEWAEFFPQNFMPKEYLDISFNMVKNSRLLTLTPNGEESAALLEELLKIFASQPEYSGKMRR